MAVEFLRQLHQVSLEKAWNARPARPPKDPMPKRRQNVLDRIDAALAQLKSGEPNPQRGSYQTREHFNGVRVQLKYGQRPLIIDGRDHWFVEDAATFFRMARKAVQSGELDAAINAARDVHKAGTAAPRPAPASVSPSPAAEARPAPVTPEPTEAAPETAPEGDEAHAPKRGKYAQRYEELLSAGAFSESAV